MPNPFIHVELQTADPETAKAFYSKLFRWKLSSAELGDIGDYTFIDVGEGTAGGMMSNSGARPSQWLAYVHVTDVEATAEKAATLGGTVLVPPTEIPGMGRFAILGDPTGGTLGIFQPKMRRAATRAPAAKKTATRGATAAKAPKAGKAAAAAKTPRRGAAKPPPRGTGGRARR